MFQLTLDRVQDADRFASPIIVANAAHAELVHQQLEGRNATIVLEPHARNTAPAIALAALAAPDRQTPLLVMPSDHVIADPAAFQTSMDNAMPHVEQGWMVTFGITPTAPETGYGYIRMGNALSDTVRMVDRFVEKPDLATATTMLAEGNHGWNGGIFLMRAGVYLDALAAHAPDILAAAKAAMATAEHKDAVVAPDAEAFAASPSDSIDYAVMEKVAKLSSGRVAVVPVSMGWSDVGSWDALYDIGHKDQAGNSISGTVRLSEAHRNLVHADGLRVTVHGLNDIIVVANGREVMVLPRGAAQSVKNFAKD